MNTITEIAPISWDEIINHPPVPNPRSPHPRCFLAVGFQLFNAATSDRTGDVLRAPGEMGEVTLCHCRIDRSPSDSWLVIARTNHGEYLATQLREFKPTNSMVTIDGVSGEVVLGHSQRTELLNTLVGLYQRQREETRLIRSTAVRIPPQASSLIAYAEAGRENATRRVGLSSRVTVAREKPIKNGKQRTIVTASVTVSGSRAKKSHLRMDEPMLPGLVQAPLSELPQLVVESLSRVLTTRGLQAVYAGINLVMRAGTIELDEDGNFSDAFRLQVMDIIGMPSATANATQRGAVRDALMLLVHAEIMVQESRTGRTEFIPMLMRASYYEADNADGTRRAKQLAINPLVLPEGQGGKSWLVPEALLQISDEADRDSTMRLLGLTLAHRVGMGSQGKSERLQLLATRAGCWNALVRNSRERGGKSAMHTLNKTLHKLRALPYRGGEVDIIGSTVIEGTTLGTAMVHYGTSKPTWAKSSQ